MEMPFWKCVICGHEEPFQEIYACPRCSGELTLEFDYKKLRKNRRWRRVWGKGNSLWEKFAPLLPPVNKSAIVTIGEGGTPLIPARRLAQHFGLKHLYLKLECCNPTGSFKDRQIALAFCKAIEWGHKAFAIASSGNAGISLAAFCARAGCTAYIWASRGTPFSKLCQMQVYGAHLFLLPDPKESGDMSSYYAAYTKIGEFCAKHGLVPMVTARRVNPLVVEGGKTIAFEIVLQLGRVPDKVFVPIGGGGLCGSTWKGFKELKDVGLTDTVPQLFGAQYGNDQYLSIDQIDKVSSAELSKYYVPLDGKWALKSIAESGGAYLGKVSARVQEAQALLSATEGVFAEPAGAASLAGLLEAIDRGLVRHNDWVVCYVTGHGLKDIESGKALCSTYNLGSQTLINQFADADSFLPSKMLVRNEQHNF